MNLTKKAVLPFKNHRGRVKSIAVIDPGEPRICSCGYAAALTLILARLSILLCQHWPRIVNCVRPDCMACSEDTIR